MRRKLLIVLGFLIIFVAGFWGVAGAQNFRSGSTSNVGANETVNSTLWISGRAINIAGNVNGDVFCAGQNVTISGSVRGDVLCAAQTITISGEVGGDVRTAAQTVTITGAVVNSVSALAQSFNQGATSAIGDDASIASNDAVFNGSVGRDVAIGANTIHLDGRVGRNVQASVSSLSLGSEADVLGNLSYTSENSAKFASGATVRGETSKSTPKKMQNQNAAQAVSSALGFAIYLLAAALLISLILVLLFPQAIHAITAHGLKTPWKALLVGLVAVVVVPVIIFLAMLSLIGIPLALLLLFTWLVVHMLAGIASAYLLGRAILRQQRNPVLIMLLGTVLLVILILIPVIGFFVYVIATLMGIGMLLLELNRRRPKPRYNLDPNPPNARG